MTDKLRHPALSQIETKRDDVFAFEIDGHLSAAETDDIYATLEKAYQQHERINLLVRIGRFDGFDWSALFSESTFMGKLHAIKHLRRYAVIGGPSWFQTAIAVFDPLFRVEVRHFDYDAEAEAWRWIYDEDQQAG
ncbi:MAG: STAS/SEC14 domain-containing protein [Alphaproteobacteria bacterium]|nr:STAS/SEC14 domain-containing protein [Alphaproteobacteria bacterium]